MSTYAEYKTLPWENWGGTGLEHRVIRSVQAEFLSEGEAQILKPYIAAESCGDG